MRFHALQRQLLDLLKQIKLIVIVRVIVRMIVRVRIEMYPFAVLRKHGFRGGERLAPPYVYSEQTSVFLPFQQKSL